MRDGVTTILSGFIPKSHHVKDQQKACKSSEYVNTRPLARSPVAT